MNFKNEFSNSTNIFSGKIISKENHINQLHDKPIYPPIKYRVVVTDNWKGELKDTIDIFSGIGGPDCGFEFNISDYYLIWASADEYSLLYTSSCNRTCLLDNSPDIDLLNNVFKHIDYDSIYLTKNEIKFLSKLTVNSSTLDLSKTVLFSSGNKLLSKIEFIYTILFQRPIEFIIFPPDKLKILPEKAIHGLLVIKDYGGQKIKLNKLINMIKKPSR